MYALVCVHTAVLNLAIVALIRISAGITLELFLQQGWCNNMVKQGVLDAGRSRELHTVSEKKSKNLVRFEKSTLLADFGRFCIFYGGILIGKCQSLVHDAGFW